MNRLLPLQSLTNYFVETVEDQQVVDFGFLKADPRREAQNQTGGLSLSPAAEGAVPASSRAARDTMSRGRGTVVDGSGQPLDGVEVFVVTSGQSVRTDPAGHYTIANLIEGKTRLRAREPGLVPADTTVALQPRSETSVDFVLSKRVAALDTIRIRTSRDDCAPRAFEGFECRRKSTVGVFRDSAEIAALKPDYEADLFDGIPGLRREGRGIRATEGLRCVQYLVNGHKPTPVDLIQARMSGYVHDIVGVEFYAYHADAPEWYKNYAIDCSLIVFWTKGSK